MWYYNGKIATSEIIDDYIGFVYLIVNKTNERRYIGKKLFKRRKTKQIKGKKKRMLVESDWQDYWSSCDELKCDIATLGKQNFERQIIYLCKTKGTCNYLELREQVDRRVLESDLWYNSYIGSKIHRSHVKL